MLMILLAFFPTRATAQVHDNAELFSAEAKQQAQATILQMKQKTGKSFLLETYKNVPPELQAELQQKGKLTFANDFAKKRFTTEGVNGVYAVIFMDLSYIQVEIGNQTRQEKLFSNEDVVEMRKGLSQAMREKHFDEALTRTATFVMNRMVENKAAAGAGQRPPPPAAMPPVGQASKQNTPPAVPGPESSNCGIGLSGLLCVGVAVVAIVMLVRVISRSRSQNYGQDLGAGGGPGYGGGPGFGGGYGQPGYGGQGYGQRGSGFGSGLLGGVLGGVAGSWIGNKVFGQEHQAPPVNPGDTSGYTPPASYGSPADSYSPPDTDSSSGGGIDFSGGDSGGGSDFGGGGDFSGGDSGGGSDSGGGGDF